MVQRETGRAIGPATLHHEGHRAVDLVRLELGLACRLPARRVGAVAGHQIVQAHPARREAFRLGVIGAGDQAHTFAHHVAVEPGRAERILGDHPARREDDEIGIGPAGNVAWAGQDGEDRWIGMIVGDGADRVEQAEIVFPGREIAVPGDDVERAVIERRSPRANRDASG